MSNYLRRHVYLIRNSPFHFYKLFSAGLFTFIFKKKVLKLAVNINLAAATRFVEKIRVPDRSAVVSQVLL